MIKNLIKEFEYDRLGSALIMTIVLTVLLSIVAVMFVLVARMDRAATSNIADNKMLESAARSIVEIVGKELVLDTPGVAGQEYYDYADVFDPWLASLQPYQDKTDPTLYKWHQISDITGYLVGEGFLVGNVDVRPIGLSSTVYVPDYPVIRVDSTGKFLNYNGTPATDGVSADADGDGIADSKWIELGNLSTSKGRRIYAAVRIIDNGGMINVNTAHTFDPTSGDITKINGSSQMQANLDGILKKPGDSIGTLHNVRCGSASQLWPDYETNVIWQYGVPTGGYVSLDISDELELRYRYCIDSKFKSRFEDKLPSTSEIAGWRNFGHLYDGDNPEWQIADWRGRITNPCDPNADRRHILTTYNIDRVIDPYGDKMINVNNADVNDLNSVIYKVIPDAAMAAQIAVNIIDYQDNDSDVCNINVNGTVYYGFERPCIYISELAYQSDGSTYSYYAIELYKPYSGDDDPTGWSLLINGSPVNINWSAGQQYHVIMSPAATFTVTGSPQIEPITFNEGDTISLTRTVNVGGAPTDIVVDSVFVPTSIWMNPDSFPHSVQRDITPHKCIRRLWDTTAGGSGAPTLGASNSYQITETPQIYIQAHPKNSGFTNIGEIGMIFRKPAYYPYGGSNAGVIGYDNTADEESEVFVNLADAAYQKIFNYLAVIKNPNDAAATKVKGRININTAPWYVIAQLPWVELRKGSYDSNSLAKAIVGYRDKSAEHSSDPNYDYGGRTGNHGFENIGELCNVTDGTDPNFRIDYYSRGDGDQPGFPDLTADDAADDFEERDLIFARISDLVTVRSDVFTAYILVRIGVDGPQKRYMVILDRSSVNSSGDKVKIRAFQTVPEAR